MAGSPIRHEKRRIIEAAILIALKDGDRTPEQVLAPVMKAQYDKALAGDTQAAAFLSDRLDGKPAQQVQLSGDADAPLKIVHESK